MSGGKLIARPRHQSEEVEAVLREAERHGWTIDTSRRKYWRALCGCGDHLKSVHLTPCTPYYPNHLLQWFQRTSSRSEP